MLTNPIIVWALSWSFHLWLNLKLSSALVYQLNTIVSASFITSPFIVYYLLSSNNGDFLLQV